MHELKIPSYQIHLGNNLDILKSIPDESIDSIVCDPPYHLQSIVKRFSAENAAPAKSKQSGVYARSSKGFMGKTWDGGDIAFNPEMWSECLRVLKAGGHLIAFGATRTIHRTTSAIEDAGFEIRDIISWLYFSGFPKSHDISKAIDKHFGAEREVIGQRISEGGRTGETMSFGQGLIDYGKNIPITAPSTEEAQRWEGWGTALKPAQEPAILARKPLSESSIARQVLKTKTGGLNIDGCRFGYGDECWVGPNDDTGPRDSRPNRTAAGHINNATKFQKNTSNEIIYNYSINGRWPANIYQCAKPSRAERDEGLEHLEGDIKNIHPTVKPLKLMRWLCRLVTPQGGTVLDPFAGSGTTLAAAVLEGFDSIGCELTEDYIPIIEGRCQWAIEEYKRENAQLTFFDWLGEA